MKKICTTFLLLFAVFMLNAQKGTKKDVTEQGINDPAAHTILKDVRKTLKAQKIFKLYFSYSLENKQENIKDSKKGDILIDGNKYKLNFMGLQITSDGKTVWTYSADNKELQITESDPKENNAANPLALIDKYEKEFRAKLIRQSQTEAVVDLIPLKNRSFHKIRLNINMSTKMPNSSEVYDKNGSVYTYKITKIDNKVKATVKDFTVDPKKYPGVEIIDLR